MTALYQVYYDDKQLSKLFPFAIPYKNEGLTIYFENDCIAKLVKATTAEKVGVCSWKLVDKMRLRVGIRGLLTQKVLESDYDVLSLTRNSHKHQMLAMANEWHPGFLPTIKLLWDKLGYKMPGEAKQPIYQNSFVAKTGIYRDYADNFIIPAMELIETDEELNKLMLQPSGYGKLNRHADMKNVKAKLGMDDYPLCPFVLERCISLWLTMKRINVIYL